MVGFVVLSMVRLDPLVLGGGRTQSRVTAAFETRADKALISRATLFLEIKYN